MKEEKNIIEKMEAFFEADNFSEVEKLLSEFEGKKDARFWMLNGKIEHKNQRWGNAINSFQKVVDADPSNKEAQVQIDIIKNIINYWNPDMFNP